MRLPTTARTTALLIAGAIFLGACSSDIGSPTGLAPAAASLTKGSSHFNPGKGNKDNPSEGEVRSYSFTIDPRVDNVLEMGMQVLELPANAVCNLDNSGYGADQWNLPCAPEVRQVKITAKVTGTKNGYPMVDFNPAMRFNPAAQSVQFFAFAKRADADAADKFTILYCSGVSGNHCVDESKTDASLKTYFSTRENEVFRRIKHFSGYVVAERGDGTEGGDALQ